MQYIDFFVASQLFFRMPRNCPVEIVEKARMPLFLRLRVFSELLILAFADHDFTALEIKQVLPAKAGIHFEFFKLIKMDSHLRGDDFSVNDKQIKNAKY